MKVAANTVVSIDYVLRDDDGEVLDSSQGQPPLVYIHGTGSLVPGLEKALEGKDVGAAIKVDVAPDQAYGERDESLVEVANRNQFESGVEIEVGAQFQVEGPQGVTMLTVVEVDGEEVTLDGNHPLAGMTLHFEVSVKDVRAATPDELKHGHVHGPGGHHHH